MDNIEHKIYETENDPKYSGKNLDDVKEEIRLTNASQAFEALLHKCGDYDLYQWKLMFLTSFCGLFTALHNMGAVFLAATPDHVCNIPYLETENISEIQSYLEHSVPWVRGKEGTLEPSRCHYYDQETFLYNSIPRHDYIPLSSRSFSMSAKQEFKCLSWTYDRDIYESTIVTEWNLVCERKWMMSTIQSSYMLGILFGAVIFSILSDRMGRRLSSLICCCLFSVSSISAAFTSSLSMLLALRFVVAAAGQGMFLVNYILLMEFVSLKGRTVLGNLFHIFFGIGFISLSFFAYLIRGWRDLQILISVPTVILIGYYWILPESPRWLLMKGREEDGMKILRMVAKTNDRDFASIDSSYHLQIIAEEVKNKPEESIFERVKAVFSNVSDLIRTPNMRRRNLIVFYSWFVTSMIYFGLTFSGANLNAPLYLAVLLSAIVEIPAILLNVVLLLKFGRRNVLSLSFLLGGAACIAIIFFPAEKVWWNLGLATFGKFSVSVSFPLVFMLSAELVPTHVRNISIGMASMCARVGSGIAPYIVDLLGDVYYAIPSTIFGILAFSAGGLALLLPETGKNRLPESIAEVEAMPR